MAEPTQGRGALFAGGAGGGSIHDVVRPEIPARDTAPGSVAG